MSRGFVKEDDQEEAPIIPPRAALPAGAINYVTPHGINLLKQEREQLEDQITHLAETDERERRRALAVLNGRLNLLQERIQSARVLTHEEHLDEVRFGAQVTYKIETTPKSITIQVVGVDEADVKQNKIAFTAPIATVMTGKKIGEKVQLKLGDETKIFEVLGIDYP